MIEAHPYIAIALFSAVGLVTGCIIGVLAAGLAAMADDMDDEDMPALPYGDWPNGPGL